MAASLLHNCACPSAGQCQQAAVPKTGGPGPGAQRAYIANTSLAAGSLHPTSSMSCTEGGGVAARLAVGLKREASRKTARDALPLPAPLTRSFHAPGPA